MAAPQKGNQDVVERHRLWFRLFLWWRAVQWTLIVCISGGSAFVASSLSDGPIRNWAALLVAICAALHATLRPERMAAAYREAWSRVDVALLKKAGVEPRLLEALKTGEDRLGETLRAPLPRIGSN